MQIDHPLPHQPTSIQICNNNLLTHSPAPLYIHDCEVRHCSETLFKFAHNTSVGQIIGYNGSKNMRAMNDSLFLPLNNNEKIVDPEGNAERSCTAFIGGTTVQSTASGSWAYISLICSGPNTLIQSQWNVSNAHASSVVWGDLVSCQILYWTFAGAWWRT